VCNVTQNKLEKRASKILCKWLDFPIKELIIYAKF
jgi:hypothetical protein